MGKAGFVFGLVMLGVGVGLGAVLFGASGQGGSVPETDPSQSDGIEDGRVVQEAPMLEGRPEEGGALLAAAIKSIPALDVERAEGAISGVVARKDGTPLEGVVVTLSPPQPSRARARAGLDGTRTDDRIRYLVGWQKFMDEHQQKSTTGPDGAFSFDGLVRGKYQVRATHLDYAIALQGARRGEAVAGDTLRFVATPMTGVRVEIETSGTGALEGVPIRFENTQGRSRSSGWNRETGVAQVGPGLWTMTVVAGENGEWASAPLEVEVLPDQVIGPIAVSLGPRPRIVAVLDFADGEPRSVELRYTRVPSGMEADPDLLASRLTDRDARHRRLRVHRDDSLRYSTPAENLESGTYLVAAFEGRRRVAHAAVELAEGPATARLLIPSKDAGGRMSVRILGPAKDVPGEPRATAYVRRGSSYQGTGVRFRSEGDGLFSFPRPEGLDGGDADLTLVVTVPGWGTASAGLPAASNELLVVEFEEPAKLSVRIQGVRGSIYEGDLSLVLARLTRENVPYARGRETVELDSDGRGTLSGVQPGEYTATLSGGGRRGMRPVLFEKITVRPGAGVVAMTMPDLFIVRVRTKAGTHTTMHRDASRSTGDARHRHWHESQTANEEGIAIFAGVPRGPYRIWAGGKQKSVEVTGDVDLTLDE